MKSLLLWSLVCTVSATPSFFWGVLTIATAQALAMLTGVAIFVGLYTAGDQWTQQARWRRNRPLRLSLKIGYITRLAISVIFPVGGFIDMFCGIFSISVAEFVTNSNMVWGHGVEQGGALGAGFVFTLITTLIQGAVLNVILFAYVLLVWGIVILIQHGR
jgi:hypothetical protein